MARCLDYQSRNDGMQTEIAQLRTEDTHLVMKDLQDENEFLQNQLSSKNEDCQRLSKRLE